MSNDYEQEILRMVPTGTNIIVRLRKAEERTKSGILIPATAQVQAQKLCAEGTVISMGPGYPSGAKLPANKGSYFPACLVPGTEVLFALYKGQDLKHPQYRVIDADDVLAIIPPQE